MPVNLGDQAYADLTMWLLSTFMDLEFHEHLKWQAMPDMYSSIYIFMWQEMLVNLGDQACVDLTMWLLSTFMDLEFHEHLKP